MRSRVAVSPDFCFVLAVGILVLPFPCVLGWFLAATFHEICHLLALKVLGVQVYGVVITSSGAQMDTEPMTPIREAICAAAGPLGALMLIMSAKWFPELSVCCFIQSVYNLLPIYPLDGGRVLRGILTPFISAQACEQVLKTMRILTLCCFAIALGYLFLKLGISLLMLPVVCFLFLAPRNKNFLQTSRSNSTIRQSMS